MELGKRSYQVVLDASDSGSYVGIPYNATYSVDFKSIIFDDKALDKPYEMTFRLVSRSSTTFNMNTVYTIEFNLAGKGPLSYQYRANRNATGILSVMNDFTTYTSTACPTYFDTKYTDNPPIYVPSLRNINFVALRVVNTASNLVVSSTAPETNYVCILNFKEL